MDLDVQIEVLKKHLDDEGDRSMLTINDRQMTALTQATRERFLSRLVHHLSELAATDPVREAGEFVSESARERLRRRMHLLLESGFEWERDVAQAIELFELHDVALEAPAVAEVLDSDLPPRQKLDQLYKLRN